MELEGGSLESKFGHLLEQTRADKTLIDSESYIILL